MAAVRRIIHVTTRGDWEWARAGGAYGAELVERDGFLHLCTPEQLPGVVDRHFGGPPVREALLGLVVDVDSLGDDLRWESASAGTERFPHLHRALALEEVREVRPVAELLEDTE